MFREFDKDKKGTDKANLLKIMLRLKKDECIIGKTPFVDENIFESLFTAWPDKCTWEYFRTNCN